MGFPRQVNVQAAPAVLGDFADRNTGIRTTVDAGAGAFIVGPAGVAVGSFVWADPTQTYVSNTGTGSVTGFIHRDQQAIITTYLADDTLMMSAGFPITVFNGGSFWTLNSGTTASAIGNAAYANYATGQVTFGYQPTSGSCTAGTVAKIVSNATGAAIPTSNTVTGSIAGTVLTVSAVGSGAVLGAGQIISGGNSSTGIVDTNTSIVSQTSGTAGGVGVYVVSISNSVTSTTITASGGGLTLTGANVSGVFAIGQVISGTNVIAGTTITGYGTGTAGGAGTYTVSALPTVAVSAAQLTVTNAMFLTVDASSTGTWALNDLLVGTGIPTTGTLSYISATMGQNINVTGAGGAGTYLVTGYYTAVTSETISVNSGVATKWVAASIAAPGSLVKMTTQLNG